MKIKKAFHKFWLKISSDWKITLGYIFFFTGGIMLNLVAAFVTGETIESIQPMEPMLTIVCLVGFILTMSGFFLSDGFGTW